MVQLSEEEQNWLREHYPLLTYNRESSIIVGPFSINHAYDDKPKIKAAFQIEVHLWKMKSRWEYPFVYNTDDKIKKISLRKKVFHGDLHLNYDGTLCLGLPERFREHYPTGFTLQEMFTNLISFFYWVAYYERYDIGPWLAERHGDDARIEYFIEKQDVDNLRKLYKHKLGKGISKAKLRNHLLDIKLRKQLLKQLL